MKWDWGLQTWIGKEIKLRLTTNDQLFYTLFVRSSDGFNFATYGHTRPCNVKDDLWFAFLPRPAVK